MERSFAVLEKVVESEGSGVFPWIDTFNKPQGIKSGNTDSVQALQKQGKFQSRTFPLVFLYIIISVHLKQIPYLWGLMNKTYNNLSVKIKIQ